jgi:serine protease Do
MERLDMKTIISRGGAAVLFGIGLGFGLPVGAQSVGAVQMARRDSTIVIRLAQPTKAMMDSVDILMRALDSEPLGSPAAVALRAKIDTIIVGKSAFFVRTRNGEKSPPAQGWIGFTPQGPNSHIVSPDGDYIQYFAYPSIISVDPNSPAARAGIEVGDLLIAYNGTDVRGHEFNLTQMLVPDRKLSVTVRRDGDTKDYTVTPTKAPMRISIRGPSVGELTAGDIRFETLAPGDTLNATRLRPTIMGRGFLPAAVGGVVFPSKMMTLFSPSGAFGASLSTVSAELAKTLKLEPGVLVNDVPDNTPAAKAGLHAGDVIVNVSGQPVPSLRALQDVLRSRISDQSVALKVIRDRKAQVLTVSW